MIFKLHSKRLSVLIASFIMVTMLLGACSSKKYADSEFLGKWAFDHIEYDGYDMDEKTLGIESDSFSIELKDTAEVSATINKESAQGTWEEKAEGVTLKIPNQSITLNKSEDLLVWDNEGILLFFKKQ